MPSTCTYHFHLRAFGNYIINGTDIECQSSCSCFIRQCEPMKIQSFKVSEFYVFFSPMRSGDIFSKYVYFSVCFQFIQEFYLCIFFTFAFLSVICSTPVLIEAHSLFMPRTKCSPTDVCLCEIHRENLLLVGSIWTEGI